MAARFFDHVDADFAHGCVGSSATLLGGARFVTDLKTQVFRPVGAALFRAAGAVKTNGGRTDGDRQVEGAGVGADEQC